MIDRSRVEARLGDLHDRVRSLASFRGAAPDEVRNDPDRKAVLERHMELSIQTVIDLVAHLLAGTGKAMPSGYADALSEAGRSGILDVAFAARIHPMAGLWNLLVHEYARIDHEMLLQMVRERLGDFCEFARQVLAFLDRRVERA